MRTDVGGIPDACFHQIFFARRQSDVNVKHTLGIKSCLVKLHGHDHRPEPVGFGELARKVAVRVVVIGLPLFKRNERTKISFVNLRILKTHLPEFVALAAVVCEVPVGSAFARRNLEAVFGKLTVEIAEFQRQGLHGSFELLVVAV